MALSLPSKDDCLRATFRLGRGLLSSRATLLGSRSFVHAGLGWVLVAAWLEIALEDGRQLRVCNLVASRWMTGAPRRDWG